MADTTETPESTDVNPKVEGFLSNADYIVDWVKKNPAATGVAAFALWWLLGRVGGGRRRRVF
jgi:hypothetical protein